ncbi:hypothetical protein [Sulfurimonas sp. CS5]|uniref:hypothetical protein n=1 Tax=Sulfurimonas sp. CS5 TaxID=3391145 RepID=UPI0039E9127C
MKNLILIFLTLIILVGCSTSSLKLNKDKELVLKYNSSDLLLANKNIDSSFLNFKDLFVTIYKLEDENGRVLFYEDARTSLNFEFVERGLYTVMYIFNNVQRYDIVYERNNLKLVQFALKDKRYLNAMIQASDSQIYSYTYGFSNKEFMKIAKKIKVKDSDTIEELEHEGLVFKNSSKALSNWNDRLVFFTPLIAPLRTMSGA